MTNTKPELKKQPETTGIKENKMGYMPINKLLITMSLPMMISMLVQALYNVVDSMYVAQLNENALTAVSLVFPFQNLMIAVATGTGVGINALLSRSLGEKNFDKANKVARTALFLALCSALVFMVLGTSLAHVFMSFQTDDPQILQYGTDYMQICSILCLGMYAQITLEKLLQATGKTMYTMTTQALGAIINIIMDPILIFGWFGFPRMEVAGAAAATVFGQITAAGLALYFNIKKNTEIKLSFRGFRPEGKIIGGIYSVGVPSIIMASIGSVMTFGVNKILIGFTSTATAVFGSYFKVQSFIFMPIFGLNNGMVPIIAYNYGAKNPARITKTIRLAVTYATCIMLVGLAAFQFIPHVLLAIFNASEQMLAIGVPAFRIISISYLLAGFCVISSSVCQAMGNGVLSLTVSLVRQLFILLPAVFVLAKLGGLSVVWWAWPFAEIFAAGLCALFLRKVYRQKIKPLI